MTDTSGIADLLVPPQRGVVTYHDEPARFAQECVKWKPGEGLNPYQARILDSIVEYERLAVRGPRRLGKTATNALAILWFALTRDAAQEDWTCIVTAGVFRQLKAFLWGQLRTKWARRLDWEKIGRKPFTEKELMLEELRLNYGSVILAATTDPAKIEGAHADEVFFLFDEAKTIPDGIFDSAEGTLFGAGEHTRSNAYVVISSTPGPPEGRFYDICSDTVEGYKRYKRLHVTLDEVIAAGQVAEENVREYEERYGRDSAWFQNHVLGEFAEEGSDGVIPLYWLELAERRWEDLGLGNPTRKEVAIPQDSCLEPLGSIGVDLGFGGQDRTVYALRHGNVISTLIWRPRTKDTTVPAGEITGMLKSVEHHPEAIVDALNGGIGVYDMLCQNGMNAHSFMAQDGAPGRTKEGIYEFANKRAAGWWNVRELLDPNGGAELAIPPDDNLRGDLLAPHWKPNSQGKIQIEDKKDIRKRLKRSTDAGDAVVHAFWSARRSRRAQGPIFAEPLSGNGSRWDVLRPGRALEQ